MPLAPTSFSMFTSKALRLECGQVRYGPIAYEDRTNEPLSL